jgi:hypothetical protein
MVTGTEQPYINVTPAIAPKPFLDYLNWADTDWF